MQDTFEVEMRQRLLSQQAALKDEFDCLQANASSPDAFSEHAGLGNHMADDASEMFEKEKNLCLQKNVAHLLSKVDTALRKLELGTYGMCESCGQPIDPARLESLPYAALCMSCKARQERG